MERFVAAGGRRTAARQAIVEAVLAADGHVTAEDVAGAVRRRFPSVNLSTVYRTLDTLEDLGVLDHVHLGPGGAVFHLSGEAHPPLVCDGCGSVAEIPLGRLRPFLHMLDRDYGFEGNHRHFALMGLCRECRGA